MNPRSGSGSGSAGRRREVRLRRMLVSVIVLLLAQAGTGIAVNLCVAVPSRHPGARPGNYVSGSFDSVVWSIGHGAAALAVHASLGLALVVVVAGVALHGLRTRRRCAAGAWSLLGGLLVIGAGFNGASFLDFSHDISSLTMALLAFGAIACYATALFLAGARDPVPPATGPEAASAGDLHRYPGAGSGSPR